MLFEFFQLLSGCLLEMSVYFQKHFVLSLQKFHKLLKASINSFSPRDREEGAEGKGDHILIESLEILAIWVHKPRIEV